MNIFYLSESPEQCAEWMVDKHCVKMILETAQLLSTAHRVLDGNLTITEKNGRKKKIWILPDLRNERLYGATHINHPSAIWARKTSGNYDWLYQHLLALLKEYTYRYDKEHKVETSGMVHSLYFKPFFIERGECTVMPSCMDAEYKISEDPVMNYRNYYKIGKAHLHNWKRRNPPEWIAA